LVFGVSALPHAEAKFASLDSDVAAYRQGVAQISMAALIERAIQTDPRLYRNQHALPRDFLALLSSCASHAARFSNLYS
jgi:hypothetical protein